MGLTKLISIIMLLYSINSYSKPVVSHDRVYRVDSRAYREVSEVHGMQPNHEPGETLSDDITRHYEGSQREGYRSNFVSTTWSLKEAVKFACERALDSDMQLDESFVIYLYEIRPDNNFYDLDASLIAARDASEGESRNRIETLIKDYPSQGEIVARGGFSNDRILRYAQLDSEMIAQYFLNQEEVSVLYNETFWAGRWIVNADYHSEYNHDTSNNQPFTSSNVEPGGIIHLIDNGNRTASPVTWICSSSSTATNNFSTKKNPSRCPFYNHINLKWVIYDKGILTEITGDTLFSKENMHFEL